MNKPVYKKRIIIRTSGILVSDRKITYFEHMKFNLHSVNAIVTGVMLAIIIVGPVVLVGWYDNKLPEHVLIAVGIWSLGMFLMLNHNPKPLTEDELKTINENVLTKLNTNSV